MKRYLQKATKMYEFVKEPTNIDGLKFFPKLTNHLNDVDYSLPGGHEHTPDNSKLELRLVKLISKYFKNTPVNIMEIGVSRFPETSFTKVLLETKHPKSKYLGVDLDDKTSLNDDSKHIYTIKTSSEEQEIVRKKLESLNMTNLSILLIDGYHSVDIAFNDWKYTDLLVKGGYVLIHDVHWHPGPRMLVEAIDETKYDVHVQTKFSSRHYGLAIAEKL